MIFTETVISVKRMHSSIPFYYGENQILKVYYSFFSLSPKQLLLTLRKLTFVSYIILSLFIPLHLWSTHTYSHVQWCSLSTCHWLSEIHVTHTHTLYLYHSLTHSHTCAITQTHTHTHTHTYAVCHSHSEWETSQSSLFVLGSLFAGSIL